ncbi:hypothetical protein NC653_036044 [Populus alba x Populus x berolinensis]|uniref:Uncharacterized protein n=1 Tax=Populus alba x Populus x berolinensis TaxID=444605 RepID=A0AAD6LJ67_9ROSI|nr:hypothetical protein NC653_036044 [Populus alba x Populus x berolinensis]
MGRSKSVDFLTSEKQCTGKSDKRETQTDHMLVLNSQKSWNVSLRSKKDVEALLLKKQEANIKRERMKKYSFSNRILQHNFSFRREEMVYWKNRNSPRKVVDRVTR